MEQFVTFTIVYEQHNDFGDNTEDYYISKSAESLIQFILSTIMNDDSYTVLSVYKQDMKTQQITYLEPTYNNYTITLEEK